MARHDDCWSNLCELNGPMWNSIVESGSGRPRLDGE